MDLHDLYDLEKEISSLRGKVVYSARKKGHLRRETHSVKLFRPLDYAPENARADPRISDFLSSAQTQKAAHELGCQNIAPILHIGVDSSGAWYVTKLYRSSLKRVIEGGIRLSAEDCYHLIHSIVQALSDFKKSAGRAHGNLKPSNVLFEGRGRLRTRKICLAAPRSGSADASSFEVFDLRALGKILWQLVQGRATTPEPVSQPSPRWIAYFGAHAHACVQIYN